MDTTAEDVPRSPEGEGWRTFGRFRAHSRITVWPLLSGIVVTLFIQSVFMVLGAAIGLTKLETTGTAGTGRGFGTGLFVWLLITLSVSAFLGAWFASVAAGATIRRDGILHSIVLWSAVALIGASITGSLGARVLNRSLGIFGSPSESSVSKGESQVLPRRFGRATPQIKGPAEEPNARVPGELSNPGTRQRLIENTSGFAAAGMWGSLALLVVPFFAALGGGLVGTRREAHLLFGREPELPPTRGYTTTQVPRTV